MGDEIQALPLDMVQLMAAGEVIDSPAAVVRELVENALDANATRLLIEIHTDPWCIRVTDNGCGLSLPDLRQAAAPHSTSKLPPQGDLWHICSLGFRGEALHSLSQLAHLEICSRPQGEAESGYCMTCDRAGRPTAVSPVAMAPGTRVTVTDLFYPLPARQQSVPSIRQQTRAIQDGIQRLALCHPGVTWQVSLDERPWLTLWPGASALHRLPQIWRRVQVTDLQEITQPVALPDAQAHLYLLLGLPDRCHRRRPDGVVLALNGRPVQLPPLETALSDALRRSLPRDRHPVAFLHLHAPPGQVDWHRSPDKSQVYLRHLDLWKAALQDAIPQALGLTLTDTGYQSQQRLTQLMTLAEAGGRYRSVPASGIAGGRPEGPTAGALSLTALAQVHNRYILAEHAAGLCLIEQHIAHERVLYEALCDRWQVVPLSSPLVLSQLAQEQVEQLQRIGLTVEVFGPDLWAVRTAPESLAQRDDCAEALLELSRGADLESALVATACRTAIRNGTPLTQASMQHLLDAWQRTHKPQTCPHGRPICLTLNESSLARYFRRHWVIGKSHGIEPPPA